MKEIQSCDQSREITMTPAGTITFLRFTEAETILSLAVKDFAIVTENTGDDIKSSLRMENCCS